MYVSGVESILWYVGWVVWVGFEYEFMYLEILLYMMLQSDRMLLLLYVLVLDWEKLVVRVKGEGVVNEWFDILEQEVIIGLDDLEDGMDIDNVYGWQVFFFFY